MTFPGKAKITVLFLPTLEFPPSYRRKGYSNEKKKYYAYKIQLFLHVNSAEHMKVKKGNSVSSTNIRKNFSSPKKGNSTCETIL